MTTDLRQAGLEALGNGNAIEAIALFDRAIASGDDSPELAVLRAFALSEAGRVTEARAAARSVLQRHLAFEPALELIDRLEEMRDSVEVAPAQIDDGAWRVGAVVQQRWEIFGSAQGGMGRVWFVRDREWDGMELAVKSLLVESGDERAKRLFRRESQVWLDLGGHPNIVSGFYTLEVDAMLRFFMEYVPGRSLAQWLDAERPLPLARALDQGIQLAAGMEYVHARGMVHRDLKPANCLVMTDGSLRITDFGLSKLAIRGDEVIAPEIGVSDHLRGDASIASAGTPLYMAPEQWRSLGDAGAPADVYAIGVTLHELLTGHRPFDGDADNWSRYRGRLPAAVEVLVNAGSPMPQLVLRKLHEQVDPLPPSAWGIGVPSDVEQIIAACLAKDPARRPASGALREYLRAAYTRHVGPYERELPTSLAPSQIGENNRAVSYFVMGDVAAARSILDGVLAVEDTALFPWINRQSLSLADRSAEPTAVAEQLASFVLTAHPGMDADRDVATFAREVEPYFWRHDSAVSSIAARGDELVSLTMDGHLSRRIGGAVTQIATIENAAGVAQIPGGLAIGAGPTLCVFDANNSRRDVAASGHITTFRGASDPRFAISGDAEGVVTAWQFDGQAPSSARMLKTLVRSVSLCSKTGLAAAGSVDGGFAVWDLARREKVLADTTGALATFIDGEWRIAIAGGVDGVIRVWDLGERRQVIAFGGHERAVTGLAFASDGTLWSTSSDGTLRSWDARRGKQLSCRRIHHGPIRALCIDERDIAYTAGDDQAVRRTDTSPPPRTPHLLVRKDVSALERRKNLDERDRVIARLAGGDASAIVDARALRERSPELARDGELRRAEHDGSTALGVPIGIRGSYTMWSRRLPWPATRIAVHPSGGGLAVAGETSGSDGHLQVWDATGQLRGTVQLPRVEAMIWSRDGRELVVSSIDARVRRLAVPALSVVWTGEWAANGDIRALACGPGATLVGSGWSRSVARSSLQSQGVVRTWKSDGPKDVDSRELDRRGDAINALASTPDGALVAGARDNGHIAVWDLATRKRLAGELEHGGEVTGLATSTDGRLLVAGSRDGWWTAWRFPHGRRPLARVHHAGGVRSIRLWSRGRHAVTSGGDGTVRIWDATSGLELGRLQGHAGAVVCDVNPFGREIATAGDDRVLHVWSVELDWLLGGDVLADAVAAIEGGRSRAWPPLAATDDMETRADKARDVWRDLEQASKLFAMYPDHVRAIHERVRTHARPA